MACTASEILALAKEQIGVSENPPGSNNVKYNTAYYGRKVSGSSYPWCCVFIWWLFFECHSSDLFFGGEKTASCTALMKYAKNRNLWVTLGYKPGDLIFYNFNSDKSAEHIGICESATKTSVTCIEGNTSLTNNDNGGKVMRRTRKLNVVLGAYRPKYKAASAAEGGVDLTLPKLKEGSRGDSVKALQILLNGYGFNCGDVDGHFGPRTKAAVKKFQNARKIESDGVVGKDTWSKLLL
ncbi:MAG: peptidoglycan-binding protein [Oscillospiraceae bacterium]|nr:peptidoglycan-binding protein [Oscillospiraceae bacterium]